MSGTGPRIRFDVVTLFPDAFPGPLGMGVVGRAIEQGTIADQEKVQLRPTVAQSGESAQE